MLSSCVSYLLGFSFIIACLIVYLKSLRLNIKGKYVVVTGCDSGFGYFLTKRLCDLGAHVFAGCLQPNGEGANQLRSYSPEYVHILPLDVRNQSSVNEFTSSVCRHLAALPGTNGLWGLVNNAGIGMSSDIDLMSIDAFQEVLQVNTIGVVRVSKAMLPLLRRNGAARVVNVASIMSHLALPRISAYCMSKAAVLSFTGTLRTEWKKFGILVSSIEPYFYRTAILSVEADRARCATFWAQADEETRRAYPPEFVKEYEKLSERGVQESSPDFSPVLNAMVDALTCRYPNRHYRISWKSFLLMLLMNWLPSAVMDWIALTELPLYRTYIGPVRPQYSYLF